jgi:hypothetical protein
MSDQNGIGDPTQVNSVQTETKTVNDVVKYETYNRVLSEAKKLKEKVREYETIVQQSQEQKLKEQNEYKLLWEQEKNKAQQLSSVLNEQEKSIVNGLKYHEFEKHLGGKLKNKDYATFIDFEKIILNPETKQVDEDSVKAVASDFIKQHSSLVEFQASGKLPNQAATSYVPSSSKSVSEMSSQELQKHILKLAELGKIK